MISSPPIRHGIARVDREIEKHLLNLARIGPDLTDISTQCERQLDVFSYNSGKHVAGPLHYRIDR